MADDIENKVPNFIRRIMPKASEAELREATETFVQYMAIVRRIYERISQDRIAADSPEQRNRDRVDDIQQPV